jgi:site-specific recombinase XerD
MDNMVQVIGKNGLTDISLRATEYMAAAKSANTLTAYRKDWQDFEQFCVLAGFNSLPTTPDTVVTYLVALADIRKVSTLERRIASISQAHQAAGFTSPTSDITVRVLMQGIRWKKGTAQDCKAPAVTADIRVMVSTLPDNLLGIRDRALLLIGFAGGFRRSELVAQDIEDIEFRRKGLVIIIRKSKTGLVFLMVLTAIPARSGLCNSG